MLDFNDLVNEIFKTPSPPSFLHLLPLPQLLLPLLPPAPVLLGRLFCPLYRPPVTSSGDIWDVLLLDKDEDEDKDENDKDNVPTGRPGYIIEYISAMSSSYS